MFQIYRTANKHRQDEVQPTSNNDSSKKHELEPDDIGIAGVRQLLDPSYSLCEKWFWLLALVACCAVCLYQTITLTVYYLSNPISVEIQMMRNDTITLPAVTICPPSLSNDFALMLDLFRQRQCELHDIKESNCTLSKLFTEHNVSLDNLWQVHKIASKNFNIMSTCGTSSTNRHSEELPCIDGRKEYSMQHKFVTTIYGTCLFTAQKDPMTYKGPETYISFKDTQMFPLNGPYLQFEGYKRQINSSGGSVGFMGMPFGPLDYDWPTWSPNSTFPPLDAIITPPLWNTNITFPSWPTTNNFTNEENSGISSLNYTNTGQASSGFSSIDTTWKNKIQFSILLHEPEVIPRHDASYLTESVFATYFTELKISVKEYRYLNTKENPCTDEKTFTDCRNDCLDKKLQQIVPCKFPFIKGSNKPNCLNSTEKLEDAYKKAMDFYRAMKPSDCDCKRKCNDIMYIVMSDVGFVTPDMATTFHLYYPINIHEVIIENYNYSLASLLSDIAGSIAFYMGVCILAIVEIINNVIKKKVARCCQRKCNDIEMGEAHTVLQVKQFHE